MEPGTVRQSEACKLVGISERTFQRWRSGQTKDRRKGAAKTVPRKLTEAERQQIVTVCCSDQYKDDTPDVIVSNLLEQGIYLCSVRTMYRVLRQADLLHHRQNKHARTVHSTPEEAIATGPNQVWTWDITWLPTQVKGLFLYAYCIIDIWDKSIVGWQIHDCESERWAKELFERTLAMHGYPTLRIHSDNGNPMKGLTLLSMLYDRGCKNSFSRPRVSNDNPFIESFFATVKGSVTYPGRFKALDQARQWLADFVDWYNTIHRHSGINYFTPQQMRTGQYISLVKVRNQTMNNARLLHPERWVKKVKQWVINHTVFLNPSQESKDRSANAA